MVKRILFFTYGAVSYLIFFGTFLYAIGFIGNFGVPTTLDGPARVSLLTGLLINTGLLTLFAVQHSVMARKWFKDGVDPHRAAAARTLDLRSLFECGAHLVVCLVATTRGRDLVG